MAAMDNTTMYEDDYAGCSTKESGACWGFYNPQMTGSWMLLHSVIP
jgi:hypothetical protein